MSTAFVPKHFPHPRLPSGRVLSDAQQYQYDVLRTVGGKLVNNRSGWWRIHSETPREKIRGLNLTAMFKLVELDLIECTTDAATGGYLFLLPELAKDVPGLRYGRVNQIVKEHP
jgi:hypothetical protein